jgi:glycosyltransferase involved in cell wall biosynthesis
MKKIGLVYSFEDSSWFSVTKIVQNLLKTYDVAFDKNQIEHINYEREQDENDLKKSVDHVTSCSISKLIFLDHRPHPVDLLSKLSKDFITQLEEVVIHVYGDFTLTMQKWKILEKLALGIKVKFICSSDKQVNLVQNLLLTGSSAFKVPFPVSDKEFFFCRSRSLQIRKKYNFKEDDFVFIYVGRISLQKNNLELIREFLELKKDKKLSSNAKLLVVGTFDNIGSPYLRKHHSPNEYFRKTKQLINSFPEEYTEDVQLIGSVKNDELIHYYNMADYFVSLSTYHDEDYGMAVAEALKCGIPCILTDWGGYSSFHFCEMKKAAKMIKVKLGRTEVDIDFKACRKLLLEAISNPFDNKQREEIAKFYDNKLEINSVSTLLKSILDIEVSPFTGFTDLLHRLAYICVDRGSFEDQYNRSFNSYYYKVYKCYVE